MIKLNDLIGFVYDLSDTQDGLKCWRMGFILCGEHPLLLTMIQVSDSGPMCPLVLLFSHYLTILLGKTRTCNRSLARHFF